MLPCAGHSRNRQAGTQLAMQCQVGYVLQVVTVLQHGGVHGLWL